MSNITLNDVENVQNSSGKAVINENFDKVEQAINNDLLHRDGSKSVTGNIDMDSNRIINLPIPLTDNEPITKGQIAVVVEGAIGDAAQEAADAAFENVQDIINGTISGITQDILDIVTGVSSNNVWYVSPSVSGTGGAGTAASPWSLEHADGGAGGLIQPGDTVLLRGQKPGGTTVPPFKPYTVAGQDRATGFNISTSGTVNAPILWKNFPGELVTFSDPVDQSAGWTKVTLQEDGITPIPVSANVYESNFTIAGTTHWVTGYYTKDNDWHMLASLRGPTGSDPYTTSTNIASMYATTSRMRQTGAYYPGPCIIRLGNGKLRIRLDPVYSETHETYTGNPFFGETTQVYPASTDPAAVDIRIYRQDDVGLTISGDFNIIDGGTRENPGIVFHGFVRGGVRDQGNNNQVIGCMFYAPYIGLDIGAVGATSAGVYHDLVIDGMLDYYKSPFSRGDVKNGIELLVNNRSQGFGVGSLASNGHLYRSTIKRCYDGTVFSAPNWEIGYTPTNPALTPAEREALSNDYGVLWLMIWDDGMQVYSRAQGANIHHNKFFGAGIARDGATSGVAQGNNKIKVHHNILDGFNWKVIWDRAGRDWAVMADSTASARSTVNGSFSAAATTITVADGTQFAALSLPANLTLCKNSAPWNLEQVQLTAVVGNNLTVVRGRTPSGGLVPDTPFALSTGDIVTTRVRDPRGTNEGRTSANVLPTHGVPSGTAYRFPWDFYHNTIMTARSFNDMPNFYLPVMMFGTEASNVESGAPKNLVFNNLFLVAGAVAANNPSQPLATAYLGATRLYTGRGENIHDGNYFIGGDRALLLIQLMRDSTGTNYDNIVDTIAEFRSPQLLLDAQNAAGYPAGMENAGQAYVATIPSQINSNYRPIDSRLLTGAVELTSFNLPNMEFYQPWIGALGPV